MPPPSEKISKFLLKLDLVVIGWLTFFSLCMSIALLAQTTGHKVEKKEGDEIKEKSPMAVYGWVGILLLLLGVGSGVAYFVLYFKKKMNLTFKEVANNTAATVAAPVVTATTATRNLTHPWMSFNDHE